MADEGFTATSCTRRRSKVEKPRQALRSQVWAIDIETVIGACQSIATEIHKRGMTVDVLFPASRDGFIPARLLAMYLLGPRVSSAIPQCRGRGCCLIVDDASYTGSTLRSATRRFEERGLVVGTACVVMGEDTRFEPDFHAIACSSMGRIVFPWQRQYVEGT